jgi:hypothetical protein
MAAPLRFFDADTGEAVAPNSTPTGRDRQYSCCVHYLTWGQWPQEYPSGFVATTTNGAPTNRPCAAVSLDLPVHSIATARLLEGQERQDVLVAREQNYERHISSERRKVAEENSDGDEDVEDDRTPEGKLVDINTLNAFVDGKTVSGEDLECIAKDLAAYNRLKEIPSVVSIDEQPANLNASDPCKDLLREMNDYRRCSGPTSSPFDYYGWWLFLKKHSPPEILEEDCDMDDSDLDWWWLKKDEKDGIKDEGGRKESNGKDGDGEKNNGGKKSGDSEQSNDDEQSKDGDEIKDKSKDANEDSDSEEELAPWEWARRVLGEELTARLQAIHEDAEAMIEFLEG